jgi:hypothetical protein
MLAPPVDAPQPVVAITRCKRGYRQGVQRRRRLLFWSRAPSEIALFEMVSYSAIVPKRSAATTGLNFAVTLTRATHPRGASNLAGWPARFGSSQPGAHRGRGRRYWRFSSLRGRANKRNSEPTRSANRRVAPPSRQSSPSNSKTRPLRIGTRDRAYYCTAARSTAHSDATYP